MSLLNILLPSNATAASVSPGMPAASDLLGDILSLGTDSQFNGLLGLGDGKTSPDLATLLGQNPQGDTITFPQYNGIAPLIQPPIAQLASSGEIESDALDLSAINSLASANNLTKANQSQVPLSNITNKSIANELTNSDSDIKPVYEEKFATRFNMGAEEHVINNDPQGRIQLSALNSKDLQNNPFSDAAKIAQDYLQKRITNNDISDLSIKQKSKTSENAAEAAKTENQAPLDLSTKVTAAVMHDPKHAELLKKFEPQPLDAIDSNEHMFDTRSKETNLQHIAGNNKIVPIAHSPVEQIQLKISQAVAGGLDKIHIKLHPAELGGVDVKMDVDESGNAKIHIMADKVTTLDLLRRDSSDLQKSLNDSGIRTEASGLEFSLRGDGQNKGQQFSDMFGNSTPYTPIAANENTIKATTNETTYIIGAGVDRINILA